MGRTTDVGLVAAVVRSFLDGPALKRESTNAYNRKMQYVSHACTSERERWYIRPPQQQSRRRSAALWTPHLLPPCLLAAGDVPVALSVGQPQEKCQQSFVCVVLFVAEVRTAGACCAATYCCYYCVHHSVRIDEKKINKNGQKRRRNLIDKNYKFTRKFQR